MDQIDPDIQQIGDLWGKVDEVLQGHPVQVGLAAILGSISWQLWKHDITPEAAT